MSFAEYRETLGKQILRFKLIGREVQSKVEVTNQEIRDYFREHIDQYREEPSTRLSRLTFPLAGSAEQREATRAKAAGALARLRQGEEFGVVLQDYKSDGSAEGGDMGAFGEGEITPAFAQAVEGLQEGGISDIVEAAGGLHILKVVERSSGKVQQFDSVKDAIRKTLMDQKSEAGFKSWAEGLKNGAYIDIRS
jgi:peptidyl-prolyl cis-trans isomerase SurA